jgi:hypothetical protein
MNISLHVSLHYKQQEQGTHCNIFDIIRGHCSVLGRRESRGRIDRRHLCYWDTSYFESVVAILHVSTVIHSCVKWVFKYIPLFASVHQCYQCYMVGIPVCTIHILSITIVDVLYRLHLCTWWISILSCILHSCQIYNLFVLPKQDYIYKAKESSVCDNQASYIVNIHMSV